MGCFKLIFFISSANPSTIRNGYYNATAGTNPNTVYGSLQCRGDASSEDCQTCAETAAKEIVTERRCPVSKQAIIWYGVCMLRYSDEYYFNIMQDSPAVYLWNTNNVTDPDKFNPVLGGLKHTPLFNPRSLRRHLLHGLLLRYYHHLQRVLQMDQTQRGNHPYWLLVSSFLVLLEYFPPSPFGFSVFGEREERHRSLLTGPESDFRVSKKRKVLVISFALVVVLFAHEDVDDEMQRTELQFKLSTISAATDNFSEANKLGEGGFGSVYKGTLSDGQEIAVKRLAKNSGQGEQEFKNEVTLVAKLQHRNLVRLLGFCIDGEEKLLVYEFMPNASLDRFLFDPSKCTHLDWERRYKIIGGIARGLLYLHEESRLKIIHRDLKASNILLDIDMNPKIGDFGMARLFVLDQTQANTNRVVGTYGYMAPEYAMHGQFSVKSDVFSFGVLVIEILSGQKNNCFNESDVSQDLLSYAWRHWKKGSPYELLDPTLKDTCSRSEAMRCIHIGLLCVQENVADGPTMPMVLLMLNSYSVSLALPSAPAFFAGSTRCIEPKLSPYPGQSEEQKISTDKSAAWSINETSISELYPR